LGLTKSPNEGPVLRVSLNEVAGRDGFVGASGAAVCGVSEVVAKLLSVLLARGAVCVFRVDEANRQRDRGIEAAMAEYIQAACVRLWREGGGVFRREAVRAKDNIIWQSALDSRIQSTNPSGAKPFSRTARAATATSLHSRRERAHVEVQRRQFETDR
jgi:hypothetical protein